MFNTWLITHLCLYQVSLSGSVPEVPAAGRALGVTESHPAGEMGKALGEQGTGTISKGGTRVVFVLCLGLLLNIHVISGPAFVTLQWLGAI